MKKALLLLTALACLLAAFPALGEAVPEALIHEALTAEGNGWGEFVAEGHAVLGTKTNGDEMEIYLAASVAYCRFVNGNFNTQSGWGAPCTLVLKKIKGEWKIKELKEIEDTSEIYQIMPKKYAEKCLAGKYDGDGIVRQIRQQAQAYLDSIGSDAAVTDYSAITDAEPGMLTAASTLIFYFLDSKWPLGQDAYEFIEEGERVVYTRLWTPDAGAQAETIREIDGVRYIERGATGVVRYEKRRKADNALLESVVGVVKNEGLTLTLSDAYGSLRYEFPYDTSQGLGRYSKPQVFSEGACRMSTVSLDREIDELSGESQTVPALTAEAAISETERFAIFQDGSRQTLAYQRRAGTEWTTIWSNPHLLPATNEGLILSYTAETEGGNTRTPSRETGELLCIYGGDECPDIVVQLFRPAGGEWLVQAYQCSDMGEYVYLADEYVIVNQAEFTALDKAGLLPLAVNRAAASFDKADVLTWRNKLDTLLEESGYQAGGRFENGVPLLDDFDCIAGAEALYIALGQAEKRPVYAYPSESAPRAAKGKAAVSLAGAVGVLCREGDWLMVIYETSPNQFRTGWTDPQGNAQLALALQAAMPANFDVYRKECVTTAKAALWDDPLNQSGTLCTLPKGAQVTVLSETWDAWNICYVEARCQDKLYRGFMAADQLN